MFTQRQEQNINKESKQTHGGWGSQRPGNACGSWLEREDLGAGQNAGQKDASGSLSA